MVQCCIENIKEFFLTKPRDLFSSFFQNGNLSSCKARIEELIKLKEKLRKEGYLFILRELAQFCFILEVNVSSQHALHMAGYGD